MTETVIPSRSWPTLPDGNVNMPPSLQASLLIRPLVVQVMIMWDVQTSGKSLMFGRKVCRILYDLSPESVFKGFWPSVKQTLFRPLPRATHQTLHDQKTPLGLRGSLH